MSRASLPSHSHLAGKGKPGRPPVYSAAERIERILKAAEQVFTTVGYGAATMEQVAHAAGMSKKTLYGFYPDKRRLLAAVAVAADDFPWEDGDRKPFEDPVQELRHRLLAATEFTLTPRQIRLTRLLIAEAEHSPDLAESFHERVMVKCQLYLATAIERVIGEGRGAEARNVTMALLGAALTELHLLALFGKSERYDRAEIVAHVDAALRLCGFSSGEQHNDRS